MSRPQTCSDIGLMIDSRQASREGLVCIPVRYAGSRKHAVSKSKWMFRPVTGVMPNGFFPRPGRGVRKRRRCAALHENGFRRWENQRESGRKIQLVVLTKIETASMPRAHSLAPSKGVHVLALRQDQVLQATGAGRKNAPGALRRPVA